jgi:hypothetical protein
MPDIISSANQNEYAIAWADVNEYMMLSARPKKMNA